MDWIDYREKLGIGFDDDVKTTVFINNIYNFLRTLDGLSNFNLRAEEYVNFCTTTGCFMKLHANSYIEEIINILVTKMDDFREFIAYYVAFINSLPNNDSLYSRKKVVGITKGFLKGAHIPVEIIADDEKYFIFPKGAKELDDALVSEPLEWLANYPNAHKTYCIALKQYSEGIYIRDAADNLRKALETFLQEFLGNTQNLESNKNNICKYLGEQGVDAGVSSLYQTIINSYKNINDRIVKHNDNIDEKLLEFLLYQTGILIRMTITVKKAENNTTTK